MEFQIFVFLLGLVLLVWGSSLFVDSAVSLANYLHLPEVLIGATVVSLGTTLPELLFSSLAAARGLPEMAFGNAAGSVLCNTGFIAGLLILLKPVILNEEEVRNIRFGTLFLGSGLAVFALCGFLFGGLPRFCGVILLLICALYLRNSVMQRDSRPDTDAQKNNRPDTDAPGDGSTSSFTISDCIRLLLETASLYAGASLLVSSGPLLARSLGVPEVVISLTMVALGTSLPEFVTSLVSLKKDHASLSLGNIIGADVLNFLLVSGASAAICPLPFSADVMRRELPFLFVLLSLLCLPSIRQKKAGRIQGALLLGGYALYLFLL